MIFPDARERVPLPTLTDEAVDLLRRRLYRPAFVENVRRPELAFSFLRPPGWEVGPPLLEPSAELPLPSLASITRKAPAAGIELMLFEPSFDCLPGDLLDCALDALTLAQRSDGIVQDSWYADRMGARAHGYEIVAARRAGKDVVVFLCAMPASAVKKCRDEVNAILASFAFKAARPGPYADRWQTHGDAALGVSFALPADARVTSSASAVKASWQIEGGAVELALKEPAAGQRRLDDVERALLADAKRLGYGIEADARGGDMPAAAGGVLVGDVMVRSYGASATAKRPGEAMLLLGSRSDGRPLVISGVWPARTAHRIAWMRARFAYLHVVMTLRSLTTA